MQKWQYRVIDLRMTDYLERQLQSYGNEGWELICIERIENLKLHLAYFKRPDGVYPEKLLEDRVRILANIADEQLAVTQND